MAVKAKIKFFSVPALRKFGKVIVATAIGFSEDRILKLSAALAYYTFFSITPLLTIVIAVTGIFYKDVHTQLFAEISALLGPDAAKAIEGFITNAQLSGNNSIALIVGILMLVIGATAVFVEIQDSINYIWRIKAVPKRGWLKFLQNRLLSFSLVISLAFVMLVSLTLNAFLRGLGERLDNYVPESTLGAFDIVNQLISFLVISGIFAVIFKVLPDAHIRWRTVISGSLFTALLFSIGKYAISLYIEKVHPGAVYGASGSIIIILVWVYYNSVILYFGAEFTQTFAEAYSKGIRPARYAVHLKTIEETEKVTTLPEQHPEILKEK